MSAYERMGPGGSRQASSEWRRKTALRDYPRQKTEMRSERKRVGENLRREPPERIGTRAWNRPSPEAKSDKRIRRGKLTRKGQ